MRASLTRVVRFRATHRLARPDWTPAQNRATFGPLTEPHEHHYTCRVTVAGPVDSRTGMVIDLGVLDRILAEQVTGALEGRDLNRDVAPFATGSPLPTCEALAVYCFDRIAALLPAGLRLERVGIDEDATLSAEYAGLR